MPKINNNHRRDFLKRIPIALLSISAFSVFKFKRAYDYSENRINILSNSEVDDIIKSDKFFVSKELKPSPAPDTQKNING